ncbi:MAG: hypothetical protein HOB22_03480 [Candidatus Marinimicrobia bacterium]|nr:hypothetical protein [Candidatus Neomarinimicrobiota bacterium]
MRNRTLQKLFLALSLYLVGWSFPQSNHLYYHETPNEVYVGDDVIISQLMFTQQPIAYGVLFFRDKGELSYQEVRMVFEGGKWIGVIPRHRVTEVGIEYVTILTARNGGRIALPLTNNPFDTPLSIGVKRSQIMQKSGQIKKSTGLGTDFVESDILILSPEDGSMNRPDEIVVSASLFNAANVDQNSLQILINGKDYTDQTIIFGDVLSLVPDEELDVGLHQIKLLFKTTYGMDVMPVEWSFNVNKGMANAAQSFTYKGSLTAKRSSSTASSISIDDNLTSGKIDGELSWIKARYSFRNSSRESIFGQPINRNTLTLQITDYLKIENGDVYPSVSPYVLDGKRVKGRHIQADYQYGFGFDGFNIFGRDFLAFDVNGTFEFQSVNGKFTRGVQYQPGIDGGYELLSDEIKYNEDGNRIYKINRNGYTFPRDVIAARLGFSLFNKYRCGFHFLKAKDDFEKIDSRAPSSSLMTVDTTVLGDSTLQYYTLTQLIDSLSLLGDTVAIKSKYWDDGSPQENLVLGFDFEAALDNRKILFQMGWNMSLTNNNIWAGIADKDSLDLMMDTLVNDSLMDIPVGDIGDLIESYKDIFTVHPLYMSPIVPIDPIVYGKSKFRAYMNMPSSAYFLRMKGSYSFNNLLIEFRQLGSQYKSFGNPYLTNNIREFTINDRLSLLGRRLMMVAGYKYRDNKLSELIANPVATKTVSFNTTLVPGPGAPSIVMNIQSIGKTNGIDSIDTDQYGSYLGDSREDTQALNIMGSVNLPGNFGSVSTTTSINVNSISYKDNLASEREDDFFFQKAETQSISGTFSTRFKFPLKTSTSFNRTQLFMPYMEVDSLSKQVSVIIDKSAWTSISTSAQYSLFKNRLRIRGGLDFMTNGETDDLKNLYGGKIGGDWDILNKLTLTFNSSIRMIDRKLYKTDESDNDDDGEVDESGENWTINSSGFNLTLGYRF